jgi:hypothetical protein
VKMPMLIFWVVTTCVLVGRYQRLGGTYNFHGWMKGFSHYIMMEQLTDSQFIWWCFPNAHIMQCQIVRLLSIINYNKCGNGNSLF